MRIDYLSPSSFKLWRDSREEFYKQKLSGVKGLGLEQNKAMALGSAFDAFIKSHLYRELVGDNPLYYLEALLESQVDKGLIVEVRGDAEKLFNGYREVGGLADLMLELRDGFSFNFEFEMKGRVNLSWALGRECVVILLGRPDVFLYEASGIPVILDYKVNGYYSVKAPSPIKGFMKARYLDGSTRSYKEIVPKKVGSFTVNAATPFELVNKDWAIQLTMYAWLCGATNIFITGIEQVVGRDCFVSGRYSVGGDFQIGLARELSEAWEIINSDHIFRELSFEESEKKCKMLEEEAKMTLTLKGSSDPREQFLAGLG